MGDGVGQGIVPLGGVCGDPSRTVAAGRHVFAW